MRRPRPKLDDRVAAFAAARRERRGMAPDEPLVVPTLTMPPWLLDVLGIAPAPQRFYRFDLGGIEEVRVANPGHPRGEPTVWEPV